MPTKIFVIFRMNRLTCAQRPIAIGINPRVASLPDDPACGSAAGDSRSSGDEAPGSPWRSNPAIFAIGSQFRSTRLPHTRSPACSRAALRCLWSTHGGTCPRVCPYRAFPQKRSLLTRGGRLKASRGSEGLSSVPSKGLGSDHRSADTQGEQDWRAKPRC